ncbi:ACP S-malonyltransferase [Fluviispira sanaruensis]|uniref:Malonyl CoA-acyl carrier protein transacylase n=1 Tax=Fluviispira sanaruensis TaxID=2493639 RepID=A0A4P2VH29_FLUSA|nr:ACP S-malonyltransferase [Fluviispira sanaruensis]BBH52176.1 [acyl-carrier-protein] S-malonyltransferase [Fluviispira sanaruensis]
MSDIVFVFPGQGSQTVGMGKEISEQFQEFKETLQEASDSLGFNMERLCFEDPEAKLNLTEFTQPAILAISIATLRVLQKRAGVNPTLVAGHSLGEYSALVSLGALDFSDALRAVHFRGQAMQRAVPVGVGAMAAYLGNSGELIPAICKEVSTNDCKVEVVNFNSPGQLVLSGHKNAVAKVCEEVSARKLGRAKELPVSAPFHSSLMQPAANEMAVFLSKIPLRAFSGKIVANVDAKLHTAQSYSHETLVKQIANAVLWTQSLAILQDAAPQSIWVEVGPGKVLQGLTKKTYETVNCLGTQDLTSLKSTIETLSK